VLFKVVGSSLAPPAPSLKVFGNGRIEYLFMRLPL